MTKTGLQTISPVRKKKDIFIVTSNKEVLDKLRDFYFALQRFITNYCSLGSNHSCLNDVASSKDRSGIYLPQLFQIKANLSWNYIKNLY